MNEKISNFFNSSRTYICKHSPEILTGIGITGMITSTVLAVKATPKALYLLEEAEKNKQDKLDTKEVIQTVWREYLPSAITCVISTSCIIGACAVNHKRNAALATAYTLSEKALTTYKEQVIKTIGEKKEKSIRDAINQDKVDKEPVDSKQIILTSKGNTLCKDSISGRYFRSDLDTIRKIINELNRKMMNENTISINEFYDAIGLDHIKEGNNIGWSIEKGLIELDFSACIVNDDEPCIVIDYNIIPTLGYNIYS